MKKAASILFAILFIISCVPSAFALDYWHDSKRLYKTLEEKLEWTRIVEQSIAEGNPPTIHPINTATVNKYVSLNTQFYCSCCTRGTINQIGQHATQWARTGETRICPKLWHYSDLRLHRVILVSFQCGFCGFGFDSVIDQYDWECGHAGPGLLPEASLFPAYNRAP